MTYGAKILDIEDSEFNRNKRRYREFVSRYNELFDENRKAKTDDEFAKADKKNRGG